MADSLVLTGSRQVTKHTGDEMLRLDYPRGGNTWQIKKWWQVGGKTVYENCTVFRVTGGGGDSVYLAILSNPSVNVKIDHDGAFNFAFSQHNEVDRAALFDANWTLIEHYVFPRISGGSVMTVTPAGAAPKPDGTVAETIGTPAVAGPVAVDENATDLNYIVVLSGGDASSPVYSWSVTGNLTIQSGQGTTQITVDAGAAGDATVVCEVSQAGASNTPQTSEDYNVTIS